MLNPEKLDNLDKLPTLSSSKRTDGYLKAILEELMLLNNNIIILHNLLEDKKPKKKVNIQEPK